MEPFPLLASASSVSSFRKVLGRPSEVREQVGIQVKNTHQLGATNFICGKTAATRIQWYFENHCTTAPSLGICPLTPTCCSLGKEEGHTHWVRCWHVLIDALTCLPDTV